MFGPAPWPDGVGEQQFRSLAQKLLPHGHTLHSALHCTAPGPGQCTAVWARAVQCGAVQCVPGQGSAVKDSVVQCN